MMIRIDITFEDFKQKILDRLRRVTEEELVDGQEDAQMALDDLKTDYYDRCILESYEKGYTLSDAFYDVYYMGQHVLDEDTCLKRLSMIRKKYGLLRDRAASVWHLMRYHHVNPDATDMDVMRAALQKHVLPDDFKYDVVEWVQSGWLLEKAKEA